MGERLTPGTRTWGGLAWVDIVPGPAVLMVGALPVTPVPPTEEERRGGLVEVGERWIRSANGLEMDVPLAKEIKEGRREGWLKGARVGLLSHGGQFSQPGLGREGGRWVGGRREEVGDGRVGGVGGVGGVGSG